MSYKSFTEPIVITDPKGIELIREAMGEEYFEKHKEATFIDGTWKELQEAGLLWQINRNLCLFGWVIGVSADGTATPKRTNARGFTEDIDDLSYARLAKYIMEHGEELHNEIK